jgi:polyhydroxyalkanoate synthesis regulator phasin
MSNDNINTAGSPGKRRGLTIGLAGGLLAGTAAGLVFGVPGLSSAASEGTSAAPAVLVQQTDETDPAAPPDAPEMGTRLRESLQELVDAGTITAEQADAVSAHLVENRPERHDGGPGGHGGRHGGGMFGRGVASEALTDLLGLDAEELRTQLREGLTLAEIAADQGVEVQAVIDELVAEVDERLDNAVENGRIDQAEADEKLADATTKITDMVNNGRPERDADAPAED